MIELDKLTDDMEVWWGYLYCKGDKVRRAFPPEKYKIKVNKLDGYISLYNLRNQYVDTIYFSSYGNSFENTLYKTKDDITEDWDNLKNKFIRNINSMYEKRIKEAEKAFIIGI